MDLLHLIVAALATLYGMAGQKSVTGRIPSGNTRISEEHFISTSQSYVIADSSKTDSQVTVKNDISYSGNHNDSITQIPTSDILDSVAFSGNTSGRETLFPQTSKGSKDHSTRKQPWGGPKTLLNFIRSRIPTLINFGASVIKYRGFLRPKNVAGKWTRFIAERFLKRKPIRRVMYNVIQLGKGILVYVRPRNFVRRSIVNYLRYLSDAIQAPEIRRTEGISSALTHRFLAVLNALYFYSPRSISKRIRGVPILWKLTLGPPDEYNYLQMPECNAYNDDLPQNNAVEHQDDSSGIQVCMKIQEHNNTKDVEGDGDVVLCEYGKCVEINLNS